MLIEDSNGVRVEYITSKASILTIANSIANSSSSKYSKHIHEMAIVR